MYAQPKQIDDLSQCSFYHRMEIPGAGEVGTQWDLRNVADDYLGHLDFRGKRVLDVGSASGFLTFEMERRGAEVVSFDMVDGNSWNVVPHAHLSDEHPKLMERCVKAHESMRNGYWFAHRRLNSNAKAYYGDIYNLPRELGNFDIVIFGMILGHLRDPFQALYQGSRLCTGNVVVTNQSRSPSRRWYRLWKKRSQTKGCIFIPKRKNNVCQAWWSLSDKGVSQMLEVLGFDTEQRYTSFPQCVVKNRYDREECRTTVTRRAVGQAEGLEKVTGSLEKVA